MLQRRNWIVLFWICSVIFLATVFFRPNVFGKTNASSVQELRPLELGKPQEHKISGGEAHFYQLLLETGQYVRVDVFQYWISVELRLFDPAGKLVVEIKLHNEDAQTEMLSAIAELSGAYKLEVKARGVNILRSTYRIHLVRQQPTNLQDKLLVEADRQQIEAYKAARKGNWTEAISLSEKSIQQYEQIYGSDHPELIEPLHLLQILLSFKNDMPSLDKTVRRILRIQEQTYGANHLETSSGLFYLGTCYLYQEKIIEAIEIFEKALKIRERELPPDDMRIAQVVSELGNMYVRLSQFSRSETFLQRSLAIAEKSLGELNYFTVMRWNDLAELQATQGNYAEAGSQWERALSSTQKLFPQTMLQGVILANLGKLNTDTGNYEIASRYLQQALPIFETLQGSGSASVAPLWAMMGELEMERMNFAAAASHYQKALTLREQKLEPEHLSIADSLHSLANVLLAQKKFGEAEELYQRAARMNEKSRNNDDWHKYPTLHQLAKVYQAERSYPKAESFLRRSLDGYERTLGPNHPLSLSARQDLMKLAMRQQRPNEALIEQQNITSISEFILSRNLLAGSENQKLRFQEKYGANLNDMLSIHTRLMPEEQETARLSLLILLRQKGRILDEMGQVIRLLRQRAGTEDLKLFNQLSDKLTQLSLLTTRKTEKQPLRKYQEQVKQINEDIEKLQANLSERSREFRPSIQPITIENVQESLPANTALVEFVRFKVSEEIMADKSQERYAAYILLKNGTVRWADLGSAKVIDDLVKKWRNALNLHSPDNQARDIKTVHNLARQLDALIMQPIRPLLGTVRQVFVAPDGQLNLLPFAALVDERGRELVRDYLFIYLTSGRDLLRLNIKHQSKDDVLVFAAPDYNEVNEATTPVSTTPAVTDERAGRVSRSAVNFKTLDPLPYAQAEAEAVKKQFPQAQLRLGQAATESALKQVQRPAMLHLITHGIFLEDQTSDKAIENPLLRSWLALAGANQRRSGKEDGILTAYEAAALDLWGTKLVTLSACDTGVGEIRKGEGVYGLRRALVLAGAETQLTSLWKIDDYVTRNLMESYYGRLRQGAGRIEALRQVQLEMLRSRLHKHPYYWAGFIGLGEWANLQGQRAAAFTVAPRGSRK